ncbi:MAG: hypothetical protein HY343_03710 [Lentisphaerae bacterium]|nr:hypothetical protein [Lentisphaerota bacterium]
MKTLSSMIVSLVIGIALLWLVWQWGFCRFYIAPNEMAVITAKMGAPLPPGQILAKQGQKGIREDVLGEGRHFLNPILYDRDIFPVKIIPPGKIGVVKAKGGQDLPEGEFLANMGQKGIWRTVLGPGKYRLNPKGYEIDIADAIVIPIGYIGVVTSLSGDQPAAGEFAEPKQKGVRKDILQPGLYYANPKEFKVDVVEVGINQVSLLGTKGSEVRTKKQIATESGAMDELQQNALRIQAQKRAEYLSRSVSQVPAQAAEAALSAGEKQTVAAKPMPAAKSKDKSTKAPPTPPPHGEETMAAFTLSQFVEFPSRDGFKISLDMTVEFELLPGNVAWIFRNYGDLPAVIDKIILPQILSVSRLKGSAYRAQDFIMGEGREKFQNDLTETLAATLKEKKLIIHNALIRHVEVPHQILDPIQQASIAKEQDQTNKEKQKTAMKQGELNTQLGLIEQKKQEVSQLTEKIKMTIRADQEKEVAETQATAAKSVADISRQTAALRADKIRKLGKAEADVIEWVEGAKASGHQMKIEAFGDPMAYNLWEFANTLNTNLAVNILHTGPGTLWTDLDKARLGDLGGSVNLQKTGEPKP